MNKQNVKNDGYNSTDLPYEFAGWGLTDGDKRLIRLVTTSLGNDHPAYKDLENLLVLRAFTKAPQSPALQEPVLCINPKVIDPQTGKVRSGTGALTYSDSPDVAWSMPLYAKPQSTSVQPVTDVSIQWLAEMIMSDCGCSTDNQSLRDQIANRIDQYERANKPANSVANEVAIEPPKVAQDPVGYVYGVITDGGARRSMASIKADIDLPSGTQLYATPQSEVDKRVAELEADNAHLHKQLAISSQAYENAIFVYQARIAELKAKHQKLEQTPASKEVEA